MTPGPDDRSCANALATLIRKALRRKRRVPIRRPVKGNDDMRRLIDDPIVEALDQAVRQIGRHLLDTGGHERMVRVSNLALDQRGTRSNLHGRCPYLDYCWDGIGGPWWEDVDDWCTA